MIKLSVQEVFILCSDFLLFSTHFYIIIKLVNVGFIAIENSFPKCLVKWRKTLKIIKDLSILSTYVFQLKPLLTEIIIYSNNSTPTSNRYILYIRVKAKSTHTNFIFDIFECFFFLQPQTVEFFYCFFENNLLFVLVTFNNSCIRNNAITLQLIEVIGLVTDLLGLWKTSWICNSC